MTYIAGPILLLPHFYSIPLIVSRLDRLSRDLEFIAHLQKSKREVRGGGYARRQPSHGPIAGGLGSA
jgi:hypothetical protein